MKRSIIIATFGVLLCTNLFSQNLKIGDFEMPITKAEKFYIGGNFNLNSNDTISHFQGDFRLDYSKFYSSLPYTFFLNVILNTEFRDFILRNDKINYKGEGYQSIAPSLYFNFKKYFSDKYKIYLNINTGTVFSHNFKNNYQALNGFYELGLGYGRTIDATSLAKALRIQEYLLSENQLSGEMDKEIVMEVAQHCDKLYQYEIDFGEKFQEEWFLDLEKIMVKSGKLSTGNLNPFSVLRIMEVLYVETIWYRPIGWNIGTNFLYNINNYKYSQEQAFGTDYYGPSIQFNVGYPINNSLHFYHSTFYRFLSGYDIDEKNNEIQSQTSLSYNLTNLLYFNFSYLFKSNSNNNYSPNKRHDLQASASYYLENNVSIVLTFKFINNIADNSSYKYNRNNNTVTLGFNYRFW